MTCDASRVHLRLLATVGVLVFMAATCCAHEFMIGRPRSSLPRCAHGRCVRGSRAAVAREQCAPKSTLPRRGPARCEKTRGIVPAAVSRSCLCHVPCSRPLVCVCVCVCLCACVRLRDALQLHLGRHSRGLHRGCRRRHRRRHCCCPLRRQALLPRRFGRTRFRIRHGKQHRVWIARRPGRRAVRTRTDPPDALPPVATGLLCPLLHLLPVAN